MADWQKPISISNAKLLKISDITKSFNEKLLTSMVMQAFIVLTPHQYRMPRINIVASAPISYAPHRGAMR